MKIKKMPEPIQLEIPITTDFIKLESFLKFAGASETGGEAKKQNSKWRSYRRWSGLHHARKEADPRHGGFSGRQHLPGNEMRISGLHLINFRNYDAIALDPDPGVNLIVGDNAQGKTNLLESIVYLSQGASYRTRKEEELIRWDQEYARLEAKIQGMDRETQLVYGMFRGARRRQILRNGVKQKSA